MFELILRAPRSKQVLVYSRFYISQNLLYSQKKFHIVGFCGFCTIEGNVNGEFKEKSEKLKFFIQNSYWEQNSLFTMVQSQYDEPDLNKRHTSGVQNHHSLKSYKVGHIRWNFQIIIFLYVLTTFFC